MVDEPILFGASAAERRLGYTSERGYWGPTIQLKGIEMIRNSKTMLLAAALAVSGAASAATYDLPDSAILVTPNTLSNYTAVTVAGVRYTGPSAYYYLSECAKPDVPYRYRCDVLQEDAVVLTSSTGSTITVTIIYQQAYTLITSGHNYWRSSQVVLAGTVTTP